MATRGFARSRAEGHAPQLLRAVCQCLTPVLLVSPDGPALIAHLITVN